VRLRGRITDHGDPRACTLSFYSRGALAEAESDAEGRFETTLKHPGAWKGFVWLGEPGSQQQSSTLRRFDVTVPDADAHELVLELDTLEHVDPDDAWDDY